tara:strand:+ start:2713 stop:3312 length:600 start_codon:yes stop_codon:yes gene_type:complete
MSPLFSQFSSGGARRTVGVISGSQQPPFAQISTRSQWQQFAQNGVPIQLYNWQTGSYDIVTPQNSPRGNISLYLGVENVEPTSWPGNNQNTYWNRTMNSSVYQMMQRYGRNFWGGRLVWNGLQGQNESCCDPNWIAGGFGGFISEGPEMRGTWQTNYTSPIQSTPANSQQYQQRYRTDGSVNTGPGFYSQNVPMYFEAS